MQEETSNSDNEMADSTTKSVFLDGTSSTSEVWGVCDDLWIELNYPSLGYKDKNILLLDKNKVLLLQGHILLFLQRRHLWIMFLSYFIEYY